MKKLLSVCCLLCASLLSSCSKFNAKGLSEEDKDNLNMFLLVGSYADSDQQGVKLYRFDEETADPTFLSGLKGIQNPSYLKPSVEGSRVYAVSEAHDSAAVYTIFLDKEAHRLTILNRQPTQGDDPCHVALNPNCHFVVTANYSGANISIFAMDIDGKLKPDPRIVSFAGHGPVAGRQEASHPHFVAFTPDQHYMLVDDLGADCIHVFPVSVNMANGVAHSLLDEDGQKEIQLAAGSGPRHLAFHPNDRYAYLLNELSGKVTVFQYNDGNFIKKQSIVADDYGAQGAADIHVSPDGNFVYASVRLQNDGIAIFSVDRETGLLTKVGYQPTGQHPRNFVITPNGNFLLVACRDSNLIQIFRIDKETGLLFDTEKTIKTLKPSCLQFVR
jgi:6-phosphogluconolactonase (cycloisomerase 2 family)